MSIDPAQVLRIAGLARLDLDPETESAFGRQIGSILDHMKVLRELPALPAGRGGDAEPTALREDDERPSLTSDEALQNAPDAACGFFRVPRVLED